MGVNMMQRPICDIVIHLFLYNTFNCGIQFIKILHTFCPEIQTHNTKVSNVLSSLV